MTALDAMTALAYVAIVGCAAIVAWWVFGRPRDNDHNGSV